jgi:hypothetical protein
MPDAPRILDVVPLNFDFEDFEEPDVHRQGRCDDDTIPKASALSCASANNETIAATKANPGRLILLM